MSQSWISVRNMSNSSFSLAHSMVSGNSSQMFCATASLILRGFSTSVKLRSVQFKYSDMAVIGENASSGVLNPRSGSKSVSMSKKPTFSCGAGASL